MKTALFFNFTKDTFVGQWDGKKHTFPAGAKKYMPEYLARHFGKHLTNRELIRIGQDTATSPKKPEEVPQFMAIFNQCCIISDEADTDEASMEIALAEKTHENKNVKTTLIDESDDSDDDNSIADLDDK